MAFESQRAKEQMAIDRGLQYQRAIQLFYRKYHLYPQTLDDLETARNVRFLRRRYLDPLTGKDWRLLHVGPAGQLTDSLVQPPAPLPGSSTGSGPEFVRLEQRRFSNLAAGQSRSNATDPNASAASSQSVEYGGPQTERSYYWCGRGSRRCGRKRGEERAATRAAAGAGARSQSGPAASRSQRTGRASERGGTEPGAAAGSRRARCP